MWLALTACERDPLDVDCPEVAAGELVITELRGAQDGEDGYGEWIEVYNASSRTVDLRGLSVTQSTLDGASSEELTVRGSTQAAAGAYVTLGRAVPGGDITHISYDYTGDYDDELLTTAAMQLFACGTEIDRVIYRNLTDSGTLSLDGMFDPPTADDNDFENNFCVDSTEDVNTPQLGIKGTPQAKNIVCPTGGT